MFARARAFQLAEYVAISAGMALSCSGYVLLAEVGRLVSGAVLLAGIVGAGALCVALSLLVGEVASRFPSAPGVRTYFRAAFGDRVSLAATLCVLAIVPVFAGVECDALARSLAPVLPGVPRTLVVTPLVVAVVGANLLGVEAPRTLQLVATFVLVVAMAGFGAAGLASHGAPVLAPRPGGDPSPVAAAAAVGVSVFLYTGFEWVAPLGRSPAAYRRDVPLAMPLALAILAVMYLAFGAGALTRPEATLEDPAGIPHVRLAALVLGRAGLVVMAALSALATITTFNAGLMGGSRLLYGLSREGYVSPVLSRVSLRTGVPYAAVIALGAASWIGAHVEILAGWTTQAGLLCAGLYCVVYGGFALASVALGRARDARAPAFRAAVPTPVRLALAVLLPALGLFTVLGDPSVRAVAAASFAAALGACGAASAILGRRRAAALNAAALNTVGPRTRAPATE